MDRASPQDGSGGGHHGGNPATGANSVGIPQTGAGGPLRGNAGSGPPSAYGNLPGGLDYHTAVRILGL